jgi:hypothetical protein
MHKIFLSGIILAGTLSLFATDASALVCAKGVYGAACVGPRGNVAARRYYGGLMRHPRTGALIRHSGPYRSRTAIRRY